MSQSEPRRLRRGVQRLGDLDVENLLVARFVTALLVEHFALRAENIRCRRRDQAVVLHEGVLRASDQDRDGYVLLLLPGRDELLFLWQDVDPDHGKALLLV